MMWSCHPERSAKSNRCAFWHSEESSERMALRFSEIVGDKMGARTAAPYQRGWCSWYHYFHAITEEAMRSNLRALKELRSAFPIEVVQLDDGYQAALGDWDRTNEKFPSGLKKLAGEIRDAGFVAGIWTAPFFAARDSVLMRERADWFITHRETGEPLAPDTIPTGPAAKTNTPTRSTPVTRNSQHISNDCSERSSKNSASDYLKLDFLYAAAAEGLRHDPTMTRAETLRPVSRRFGAAPAIARLSSVADARSAPRSASSMECASDPMLHLIGARLREPRASRAPRSQLMRSSRAASCIDGFGSMILTA